MRRMPPEYPLGHSRQESKGDGMSETEIQGFQKTAEALKRLGKEYVENTGWSKETKARILDALNKRVDELAHDADQKIEAGASPWSACTDCGNLCDPIYMACPECGHPIQDLPDDQPDWEEPTWVEADREERFKAAFDDGCG
jgi:rubrerythrin